MTGLPPRFRTAPGLPDEMSPIGTRDELVAFFEAGAKPAESRLLGVEYERLPLHRDGTAVPFQGAGSSVQSVFEFLAGRGYDPVDIEGHVLMLRGSDFEVHLEPGAQVELVLPPLATAGAIESELVRWRQLLVAAAEATGVHVVAIGLQPVTPIRDIEWIPKGRYALMREHLGRRGRLAHHMMKATAGFQLNVDFTSEPDAADLVRTALAVSPLVNVLLLNAPLEDGRPNGYLSKRPAIWAETDPDRCGLLPWVFSDGFTFRRYVDWALSVPVMFVNRDGRWHALGDRSFGEFLDAGHPRFGPALHLDFHLHLTTLFPEVRVKQHVEIRGADSCSAELVSAACALWRGILYDATARGEAMAMVEDLTRRERLALHEEVGRVGLSARVRGRPVGELSSAIIDLAAAALERLDPDSGRAEAARLEPLRAVLASRRTAAEELLASWPVRGPAALLERL